MLPGPSDLTCLTYHPTRSCLATGAAAGFVLLWGIPMNWTAFAPDFQALPKNVEYVEKEDEFEGQPISKIKIKMLDDEKNETAEVSFSVESWYSHGFFSRIMAV